MACTPWQPSITATSLPPILVPPQPITVLSECAISKNSIVYMWLQNKVFQWLEKHFWGQQWIAGLQYHYIQCSSIMGVYPTQYCIWLRDSKLVCLYYKGRMREYRSLVTKMTRWSICCYTSHKHVSKVGESVNALFSCLFFFSKICTFKLRRVLDTRSLMTANVVLTTCANTSHSFLT